MASDRTFNGLWPYDLSVDVIEDRAWPKWGPDCAALSAIEKGPIAYA